MSWQGLRLGAAVQAPLLWDFLRAGGRGGALIRRTRTGTPCWPAVLSPPQEANGGVPRGFLGSASSSFSANIYLPGTPSILGGVGMVSTRCPRPRGPELGPALEDVRVV